MTEGLIKAYQITIEDFETQIRTTPWWRFRRILYLQKELAYFEGKLQEEIERSAEYGS